MRYKHATTIFNIPKNMALQTVVNDILWNLDIISEVTNQQTLKCDGNRLEFDNRYLQYIRRSLSNDSRQLILHTIQKTFLLIEEIIQSYQYVLSSESLRVVTNKTPEIPDGVWVQNEQVDIANNIYDNLQNFILRKNAVIQGLRTLSTFERYNTDTSFKIEMNRFIDKTEKLTRKCETIRSKMRQIYKQELVDNVQLSRNLTKSTNFTSLCSDSENKSV